MQKSDIIRIIFFILFFSIGAASLGLSVLCEDLVEYYSNIQLHKSAQKSLEKLEKLNQDYDIVLKNIQEDPNNLKRIAPIVTGNRDTDPNSVNPTATVRQLAAARRTIIEQQEKDLEPQLPLWLVRVSESQKRMILFFSGVALMMISFVCFRPVNI